MAIQGIHLHCMQALWLCNRKTWAAMGMITFPCLCSRVYHHAAEIVQEGGEVKEEDWKLIFICVCGNEIREDDLWNQPSSN